MRSLFVSLTFAISSSVIDQERRHALQEQNKALADMVSNLPVGICVYKRIEGNISCIATNEAFGHMIGKPIKRIVGESFDDLCERVYPEDRKLCAEVTVAGLIKNREVCSDFRSYNYKTKNYFWMHL